MSKNKTVAEVLDWQLCNPNDCLNDPDDCKYKERKYCLSTILPYMRKVLNQTLSAEDICVLDKDKIHSIAIDQGYTYDNLDSLMTVIEEANNANCVKFKTK